MSHEQKVDLLLSTAGSGMSEAGKNLLRLLLRNGRAEVLPEISTLYEELKERDEGVLEASVASAFALTDDQLQTARREAGGSIQAQDRRPCHGRPGSSSAAR